MFTGKDQAIVLLMIVAYHVSASRSVPGRVELSSISQLLAGGFSQLENSANNELEAANGPGRTQ